MKENYAFLIVSAVEFLRSLFDDRRRTEEPGGGARAGAGVGAGCGNAAAAAVQVVLCTYRASVISVIVDKLIHG